MQSQLARVSSFAVPLVFGWIVSMVVCFGAILLLDNYGIAGDYVLPLTLWFIVSFFGSPLMLAYIPLKGLKYRWVEMSVTRHPDAQGGLEILLH